MAEVYLFEMSSKDKDTEEKYIEAAEKIFNLFKDKLDKKDKVAIKLHFGEKGNRNYVSSIFVKELYDKISKIAEKVVLIECNVLYKSERTKASSHIKLAKSHGFNFSEIVIADGELGDQDLIIPIKGKHFKEVKVGKALEEFNFIVNLTHVTGHGGNGLGGALKNLGMGLGSRAGKLAMHNASHFELEVNKNRCIGCGECAKHCPVDAITINEVANINPEKCIACAKCIGICKQKAIAIPWASSSAQELQERIVEYCYGILKNRKIFNISFMIKTTADCDCWENTQTPFMDDKGILASFDIVSIDSATLDIIGSKKLRNINGIDSEIQINYASKLGLGNKKYKLVKI